MGWSLQNGFWESFVFINFALVPFCTLMKIHTPPALAFIKPTKHFRTVIVTIYC